jgi:hypothetical protein
MQILGREIRPQVSTMPEDPAVLHQPIPAERCADRP